MNETTHHSANREGPGDAFHFQRRHGVLLGLVLWVFGGNLIWAFLDKVPPAWDQSRHFFIAVSYWKALDFGAENWWFDVLNVEPFYPPLYHLSLLPYFALFGFSPDNAILANSVYMAVTLLSTYGIGTHLYDRRTGLLAAFLVSCYPFLAYISRMCIIDGMLTSAVALGYYLFLKSENFEDRRYTFLFSLNLAAGLLVKWTFVIFILPALILGLWGPDSVGFKRKLGQGAYYLGMIAALMVLPFFLFVLEDGRWMGLILEIALVALLIRCFSNVKIPLQKAMNLVTLTGVCLLICFPWYGHNMINVLTGAVKSNLTGVRAGHPTGFGFDHWIHYIRLLEGEVSTVYFVLFLVALSACVVERKYFRPVLFWWIVGSYIILSLLSSKLSRYIMPVLPAMALVSAVFICQWDRTLLRRGLIGVTVAYGLALFFLSGFVPANKFPLLKDRLKIFYSIPNPATWPIESVMDDIVAESPPARGQWLTVRTLTNTPYFQRGLFRNDVLVRDLPIVMKSVKRNVGEMTDFFITKEGRLGPDFSAKDINPKKKKLLEDPALRRTFPLFRKYPLPDGTNGLVFKRDVSPANDIQGADDLEEVGRRFLEALAEYPIYGIREGKNMTVSIEPTENPQDVYLGRYKNIRVRADSAVTNKVRLHDFALVFEGVQINLYDLFLNGKLILFELERIFPRGTIRFEELEELAARAMKGRGEARLEGHEDQLVLKASYRLPRGNTVTGRAVVRVEFEPGRSLKPVLESLNLGPVSVPPTFYRRMANIEVRLQPTPGWPLSTDIRSVKIYPRRLEINQPGN